MASVVGSIALIRMATSYPISDCVQGLTKDFLICKTINVKKNGTGDH